MNTARSAKSILLSTPRRQTAPAALIFHSNNTRTQLFPPVKRRSLSGVAILNNTHHQYHRPRIQQREQAYRQHHRLQSTAAASLEQDQNSPQQSPAATQPPPQPPRSRARRLLYTTAVSLALFALGFGMSAAPAAGAVNGFLHPPTDAETLTLFVPASTEQEEINKHITSHPLAAKLREQPGWTESRPHLKIPPSMRTFNLTSGVLMGEHKIEVPPLCFNEKEAELPSLVQLLYVGPALCGHPGIVHGGLLATLLDEGLARACFPALPHKVAVTASLKIDYRVPCPANSYIVLKAHTTKVEGRKAWVKGWIELLGDEDGAGTKFVEAEALFIEPKQARHMPRAYSSQ